MATDMSGGSPSALDTVASDPDLDSPRPVREPALSRVRRSAATIVERAAPRAAPDSVPQHTRSAPMAAQTVVSAVAGFVGSFLLMATAPVWKLAPVDPWQFDVAGFTRVGSSLYGGLTFVTGIALLILGWIGIVGRVRHPVGTEASRLRLVVAVCILWAIPMLLTPPQLSNDAYSYAAQGELRALGKDPTAVGPQALRGESREFWRAADPIWRDAPAPYGPVAIGASTAAVLASGHDPAISAWGLRLVSVLGVILGGIGVVLIARARGGSPAVAFAIGIANPVVLVHLIGGSHNDALMLGLLLVGLAANERGRKFFGVALIAAACAVKLPAALALVFVGWNWWPGVVPLRKRVLSTAGVFAGAGALIVALCLSVGIGFGWVGALSNTSKVFSTFSVFTKLGFLAEDLAQAAGVGAPEHMIVNITRLIGLLIAACITLVLLVRSPRIGTVKAVGLGLLAFMLLGPVVWPWYLPVGFALLAASGVHRFRPTLMVLIAAAGLSVWPTSVSPIDQLSRFQHWLGFAVLLLIAAVCIAAQRVARAREARRERLGLDALVTDRLAVVSAF